MRQPWVPSDIGLSGGKRVAASPTSKTWNRSPHCSTLRRVLDRSNERQRRPADLDRFGVFSVRDDGQHRELGHGVGLAFLGHHRHLRGSDRSRNDPRASEAIEVDRFGAPPGDVGIHRDDDEQHRATQTRSEFAHVRRPRVELAVLPLELDLEDHRTLELAPLSSQLDHRVRSKLRRIDVGEVLGTRQERGLAVDLEPEDGAQELLGQRRLLTEELDEAFVKVRGHRECAILPRVPGRRRARIALRDYAPDEIDVYKPTAKARSRLEHEAVPRIYRTDYTVAAHFHLSLNFLGSASGRYPLPPRSDFWPTTDIRTFEVEINAPQGTKSCDLILHLVFEEFASDGAFNEVSNTSQWEEIRSCGFLQFPKSATEIFMPRTLSVVESCWKLLSPFVARLATWTQSPKIYDAFWTAVSEHHGYAIVQVESQTFTFKPLAHYSDFEAHPLRLSSETCRITANAPFMVYEQSIMHADSCNARSDMNSALIHLTMALETAAYGFADRLAAVPYGTIADNKEFAFNPTKYFTGQSERGTPHKNLPPGLAAYIRTNAPLDAQTLESLKNLWETRHNIVHRNLALIVPSRPELPAPTRADYNSFRSSVCKAISWMGLAPIG